MKKYLLIFGSMLSGFFIPASYAQRGVAIAVDSLLSAAYSAHRFNGNVLIAEGGVVILRKSYGFMDSTRTTLLTNDYRFHIGSVAKEFNAVAIMMLREQGKLSLDDKVSRFLPELPAWASRISVLNLLQYTSGLPDVAWSVVHSDVDAMAELMRIDTLNFAPGTSYHYNNNNTFLQRRIVERITGMAFNNYITQVLFVKAGMLHSVVDPTEADLFVARGFKNNLRQDPLQVPISGWAAVTSEDFYRWALALREFKLISPSSTAEILTPWVAEKQAGLGGGLMKDGRLLRHRHDGTAGSYQALLVDDAARGRTVILMTNNKQNNLDSLASEIEVVLDRFEP